MIRRCVLVLVLSMASVLPTPAAAGPDLTKRMDEARPTESTVPVGLICGPADRYEDVPELSLTAAE